MTTLEDVLKFFDNFHKIDGLSTNPHLVDGLFRDLATLRAKAAERDAAVEELAYYKRSVVELGDKLREANAKLTALEAELPVLRAAQEVCKAVNVYKNEPATTMTGQPNKRKNLFRDAKCKAFRAWLSAHEASQGEGQGAPVEAVDTSAVCVDKTAESEHVEPAAPNPPLSFEEAVGDQLAKVDYELGQLRRMMRAHFDHDPRKEGV